jgi:tetratricopeptide (TPR) repeat protein
VKSALDEQSRAWISMHREVCEATHVRGEQSADLLDLRMLCLDARLGELKALVGLFSRADAETVRNAVKAARSLTDLSGCANLRALKELTRPPESESGRARLRELQEKLGMVHALRTSFRYRELLPLAKDAASMAKDLGYAPAQAEALLAVGDAQEKAGELEAAEQTLHEALWAAQSARADELVAQAAGTLVLVVGHRQARFQEAQRWSRFAQAALGRAGENPRIQARLHNYLGAALEVAGRYDEAISQHRQALALQESTLGTEHVEVGRTLNRLGIAEWRAGRHEQALTAYGRARALWEKIEGPDHADVGAALHNLGLVLVRLGRYAEAREHYRQALKIFREAYGPIHGYTANALVNLGIAFHMDGQPRAALRHCREGLAILKRSLAADHFALAVPIACEGHALERQGDLRGAESHLRHALALREKALGPEHPRVAELYASLGTVLLDLGQPRKARPLLEQALRVFESKRIEFGLARLRFALARALAALRLDRHRAIRLAREARDLYARLEPARKREIAAVEAWLGKAGRKR